MKVLFEQLFVREKQKSIKFEKAKQKGKQLFSAKAAKALDFYPRSNDFYPKQPALLVRSKGKTQAAHTKNRLVSE